MGRSKAPQPTPSKFDAFKVRSAKIKESKNKSTKDRIADFINEKFHKDINLNN